MGKCCFSYLVTAKQGQNCVIKSVIFKARWKALWWNHRLKLGQQLWPRFWLHFMFSNRCFQFTKVTGIIITLISCAYLYCFFSYNIYYILNKTGARLNERIGGAFPSRAGLGIPWHRPTTQWQWIVSIKRKLQHKLLKTERNLDFSASDWWGWGNFYTLDWLSQLGCNLSLVLRFVLWPYFCHQASQTHL